MGQWILKGQLRRKGGENRVWSLKGSRLDRRRDLSRRGTTERRAAAFLALAPLPSFFLSFFLRVGVELEAAREPHEQAAGRRVGRGPIDGARRGSRRTALAPSVRARVRRAAARGARRACRGAREHPRPRRAARRAARGAGEEARRARRPARRGRGRPQEGAEGGDRTVRTCLRRGADRTNPVAVFRHRRNIRHRMFGYLFVNPVAVYNRTSSWGWPNESRCGPPSPPRYSPFDYLFVDCRHRLSSLPCVVASVVSSGPRRVMALSILGI